ncbi:hypothetical protein DFH06DRAFT_1325211 [Mycena polygramma]|nr:hypothetical protein DFH06DRAFT_1339901 [Mycena polygramma]KAJ7661886.1 hypothetical protein DFH06DRAFT_1325211 [Mycena polygramma]
MPLLADLPGDPLLLNAAVYNLRSRRARSSSGSPASTPPRPAPRPIPSSQSPSPLALRRGRSAARNSSQSSTAAASHGDLLPVIASSPTPLRRSPRVPVRGHSVFQPYPPGLVGAAANRQNAARNAARRARRVAADDLEVEAYRRRHTAVPSVVLRVRAPPPPDHGSRVERVVALTVDNILCTEVKPPAITTTRSHQTCGICLHIKSHPVSYRCGHSHCYRCVRVWLESDFRCPTCRTTMHMAPCRHYGEEDGIQLDHPTFVDRSVVDYSWAGLRFPKARKVPLVVDDEDL